MGRDAPRLVHLYGFRELTTFDRHSAGGTDTKNSTYAAQGRISACQAKS